MIRSKHEIALLRLVAQRLAGPGAQSAVEAVRWLSALQAQDLSGALTSVALRTASRSRAEVEAALDAGEVVRSWPMRGTLHLIAAEDLPWMLGCAAPRAVARAAARRAELGLDDAALEHARDLTAEALAGGRHLRRNDLLAMWSQHGLAATGPRGSHLLGYLAQTGTVCLGPLCGNQQLVVLVDDWIGRPRPLEREEALGEWAERYFRSHGPASVQDFQRWTGLRAGEVRTAVALVRRRLERFDVDGSEHLMDPKTPELLDAHRRETRGVLLLPGFDELLLGYADRSATLPTEFADRIVPGGNGVFRPTIVSDGRVVGTWTHTGRGAKRMLDPSPFTAFGQRVETKLARVYAALP